MKNMFHQNRLEDAAYQKSNCIRKKNNESIWQQFFHKHSPFLIFIQERPAMILIFRYPCIIIFLDVHRQVIIRLPQIYHQMLFQLLENE